ncbi:MAG: hypothetical protein IPM64_08955 [Phycisphaerales bacterium]|nr:hypothetical protein [Phycisphaerales bacterium]
MTPAARALFQGLFDYAGLFPPAQLPMDAAIRIYARDRLGPDAWMLGRFICPASRLSELTPYRDELFGVSPPVRFSALGRGAPAAAGLADSIRADLADVAAFESQHAGRVRVGAYELRLPADLTADACTADLVRALEGVVRAFEQSDRPTMACSFEIALGSVTPAQLANLASGLAFVELRLHSAEVGRPAPALKLRCGGVKPADFPPVEIVAAAIRRCAESGVPFKCTAGLHHPIRRWDAGIGAWMHGFVNVFLGAILAREHNLEEERICEILADSDAGAFRWSADGAGWRDLSVNSDEIAAARSAFATSLGTCSFDEPRDDLRSAGVL